MATQTPAEGKAIRGSGIGERNGVGDQVTTWRSGEDLGRIR